MAKNSSTTPHDAVFKQFLQQPDTARDFLDIHLPAPLRNLCDLNTLKLESESFIEEDLHKCYSDVLWSVQTQDGQGYIYVVIEHQSSPDELMAFRLLRYTVSAIQRHLEAGHKTLPLVVPMLFYHGEKSPYPYPMCWLDLFPHPDVAKALYTTDFPLVDITVTDDDKIMQHRRIALLELIQKHIRQRDLTVLVEQLVALLALGYTSDTQVKTLFNYIFQYGGAARASAFFREMAERSPKHKEELMTLAEKLHEEGKVEGLQIGRQEGRQEGRRDEALRIARSMLANGFDRHAVMKITGLSAEDLQTAAH